MDMASKAHLNMTNDGALIEAHGFDPEVHLVYPEDKIVFGAQPGSNPDSILHVKF